MVKLELLAKPNLDAVCLAGSKLVIKPTHKSNIVATETSNTRIFLINLVTGLTESIRFLSHIRCIDPNIRRTANNANLTSKANP